MRLFDQNPGNPIMFTYPAPFLSEEVFPSMLNQCCQLSMFSGSKETDFLLKIIWFQRTSFRELAVASPGRESFSSHRNFVAHRAESSVWRGHWWRVQPSNGGTFLPRVWAGTLFSWDGTAFCVIKPGMLFEKEAVELERVLASNQVVL